MDGGREKLMIGFGRGGVYRHNRQNLSFIVGMRSMST